MFRQLRKFQEFRRSNTYFGFMMAVIFITAPILYFINRFSPPEVTPILAQSDGLVQVKTVEQAQKLIDTPIPFPTNLIGSNLFLIGVYKKEGKQIPAESVAIVLTRDQYRFVEIFAKPRTNILYEKSLISSINTQEIHFADTIGYLLNPSPSSYCIEPKPDGLPGACHINKLLLIPWKDLVVSISSDGDHATEGELISLARDLLSQDVASSAP